MPFARTDNPTPAALAKRLRRLAAGQMVTAYRTGGGRWLLAFHGGRTEVVSTTEAAIDFLERLKRVRPS